MLTGLRAIISPRCLSGERFRPAREIPGYIAAAEGIELAKVNPDLHRFLRQAALRSTCPTSGGGPGSLIKSMEERPNNWGTHAMAAVAMTARYIGDIQLLAHVVQVFKGFWATGPAMLVSSLGARLASRQECPSWHQSYGQHHSRPFGRRCLARRAAPHWRIHLAARKDGLLLGG